MMLVDTTGITFADQDNKSQETVASRLIIYI